jgi:hypothetical protein
VSKKAGSWKNHEMRVVNANMSTEPVGSSSMIMSLFRSKGRARLFPNTRVRSLLMPSCRTVIFVSCGDEKALMASIKN